MGLWVCPLLFVSLLSLRWSWVHSETVKKLDLWPKGLVFFEDRMLTCLGGGTHLHPCALNRQFFHFRTLQPYFSNVWTDPSFTS